MSRGLAFSKKKGDQIDSKDIEKFFVAKDYQEVELVDKQNKALPVEYQVITKAIMQKGESVLGDELSKNLAVTLGEHIYQVVEQHEEGIHQANILNAEIKRFYPEEYAVGAFALEQIEKEINVVLQEDEVGFIALYVFACQMNDKFHIT